MSQDYEVRDAVIKLETKMEAMSDSLASMASSIEKLADVKYEIKETKQDIETKYQRYLMDYHKVDVTLDKIQKDIHSIADKQRGIEITVLEDIRRIEEKRMKDSWFIANAAKLGWIFITAVSGLIVAAVMHNTGNL